MKEELKAAKILGETLENSHGQLIKELEAIRIREQATRVEVFALRLYSARLQQTLDALMITTISSYYFDP